MNGSEDLVDDSANGVEERPVRKLNVDVLGRKVNQRCLSFVACDVVLVELVSFDKVACHL